MKRWLRIALILAGMATSQAQWEIVSVGGRDYVPLSNVARFYDMEAPVRSGAKGFACASAARTLAVALETREATIDGVKHWLSAVPILHDGNICVSRMDVAKTIEPAFRPEKVAGIAAFDAVVLDPGHGGHDNGARCSFGSEKDAALDVSRRVRKQLQKTGLRVVMTRDSDVFVPLERRPALARSVKKSIFVSIHFNSASWNPAANGLEIYCFTPKGMLSTGSSRLSMSDSAGAVGHSVEDPSFVLATTVFHALLGKTRMTDRGVKRERFAVLRRSSVPAVLIEGGFFTNAPEAARISTEAWREQYATAVAAGILEYKRVAEQKALPRRLADYRTGATTGASMAGISPAPPSPAEGASPSPVLPTR